MSESVPTKWLTERAADLLICLRFCTRLLLPPLSFEQGETAKEATLADAAAMLPVAGAIIGAAMAFVLYVAAKLGLTSSLAALLAIGAGIVLTGALHEDGLADFADALGGSTAEQRLAIMKDSRIGSFGALALILVTLARIMSVALLSDQSLALAATVLIAASASSRLFALLPLNLLEPARADGLGAATAATKREDLVTAGIATLIFGLLPLLAGAGLIHVLFALILPAATAYGITHLARRLVKGQTGDIAGATQQIAELAAYLVFSARL